MFSLLLTNFRRKKDHKTQQEELKFQAITKTSGPQQSKSSKN